ncbi:Hypothetical protein A7982_11285 [Minicystis rosea]|nr:Hypothetical protein A7982_11285 [Minicystis rosea]
MTCPTEEELIALLDGEATERRASELRAHLGRCQACREVWASLEELRAMLAAPLIGVPLPGASERIQMRIAAELAPRVTPVRSQRRVFAWLGAALGMAAAVAAVVVIAPRNGLDRDAGMLSPRGDGAVRSLRRDVGVSIFRASEKLVPIADGETVDAATAYAVSHRNIGPDGSAFLMVFAVDAAHVVHWIHPAYLDAKTDPASVSLAHADRDTVLPGAVTLEAPAPGSLRIVTLIGSQPIHVSQIEALAGTELALDRLRARFGGAEVSEIHLTLRPGSAP